MPERCLDEGTAGQRSAAGKRTPMPFGAGPRMGPGRCLTLLEIKMAMAMAMLLGRLDIAAVDTPDGNEAEERLAFTMTPVGLLMSAPRPAAAGRPPRGSRKVAKPHFLGSLRRRA